MRWQRTLPLALALAGVPLCLGLIMLLIAQSKSNGSIQRMNAETTANQADMLGQLVMLDPQGDTELAERVTVPSTEPGTTVQIILSRKVSGYELPCLGFTGFPGLESRVADNFGLVVFGGELYPDWPMMVPWVESAPYIF